MILKLKPITVREHDELEPIILANPEVIEQGFQIIAHQHPTDSGPLDILGVDAEETLVIIELKNEADDGHLDQGLRYYDWCRQNLAWLAQAYSGKFKINPEVSPRLILIAPSFTETVKRIAKYVDVTLQLFEYHAVEGERGEKGIICTEIVVGPPPEPPTIPTIEKKLEYFQDGKVRELFKTVLTELQHRGIEVRPIQDLWISFWYKGKRFMHMSPTRNFFVANILSPGGDWSGRQRITTREDWDEVFNSHIAKYLEYLDSNGR
jgi:Holliday junction resolvase-like predicted endonuclease